MYLCIFEDTMGVPKWALPWWWAIVIVKVQLKLFSETDIIDEVGLLILKSLSFQNTRHSAWESEGADNVGYVLYVEWKITQYLQQKQSLLRYYLKAINDKWVWEWLTNLLMCR